MKFLVIFFIIALLWPEPLQAFPTQGKFLFEVCRSGKETADHVNKNGGILSSPENIHGTKQGVYCMAYIQAAEDDLSEMGEICLSKYPTRTSYEAILDYFQTHPELAKKNARIAVSAALKETHPCR
ncbi:Rap1a/Tai family immunity protein [Kiloniella antarctica]|uniref:Rap1a/Tai family immunity protein n=1 Tax=Kiloniella antarctica TaxID=1550907 RepID=A0ABW5BLN0_9PROT